MRCKACDKVLTEYEMTRRSKSSNEFIDLCNHCYKYIQTDVQVVDKPELLSLNDVIDLFDET